MEILKFSLLILNFLYLCTKDFRMRQTIHDSIKNSIAVKTAILNDAKILSQIESAAKSMLDCYQSGHKVLLAGNGGSAADAQHLAAELVNRFRFDHIGLPAIALSTDTSILTSIGNDYGYDFLFSRQIAAQGSAGDVFIGISTSGNSKNILQALSVCKEKNIYTIGLTGCDGGKMLSLCDNCIVVPSEVTARIQEAHILIGHILCEIVENSLFKQN